MDIIATTTALSLTALLAYGIHVFQNPWLLLGAILILVWAEGYKESSK